MTNIELYKLLKNGDINVIKNNIPNLPLKTILNEIRYTYNGKVDFNSIILKINDDIVEVEDHKFEWHSDKILKMK